MSDETPERQPAPEEAKADTAPTGAGEGAATSEAANLDEGQLLRMVEAILFAAAEPVSEKALQARLPDGADVEGLLATLQGQYARRGVNLVAAGKTWAMRTAPDLGPLLARQAEVVRKLSRAAVETMAIIAYHQPVTRAEIEEIRGVAISKGTLDTLLEAGWVRPRGRRQTPGRPVTWGTTDAFLHHFDLASLDDLPGIAELKASGLLDASPALQAYRESDMAIVPTQGDNDDEGGNDQDDGAELLLPFDADDENGDRTS